MEKNKFD